MKQEYVENGTTLAEAKELAIRVLSKTLDMTKLTPEKGSYCIVFNQFTLYIYTRVFFSVEMAQLTRDTEKNITKIKILSAEEVGNLINDFEAKEKQKEAEKKQADQLKAQREKSEGKDS